MADEYYSFEDVLKDLEIGEEELKRMVSEGELRAFRDENKMKFRRDDVESLRKGRTNEPTLILPAQQDDEQPSDQAETILDLDAAAPVDEAGPALELPGEAAGQGSDTQDVTKQLDFTDTDITVADEQPVSDGGGDVEEGTTTEPLQLVEEGATEPVPTEGEAEPVAAAAVPRRGGRMIEITEADEEAIEARRPHWIWSILLLISFGVTAYSGVFIYELLRIQGGRAAKPSGLTEGLTKKFTDSTYSDSEWKKRHWSKTYPPNTLPPMFPIKASWQFSVDEQADAKRGVPIEGPEGSMRQGGGTPDSAAPAAAPPAAPAAAPEKKDDAPK
jgi:hypothetical protein